MKGALIRPRRLALACQAGRCPREHLVKKSEISGMRDETRPTLSVRERQSQRRMPLTR